MTYYYAFDFRVTTWISLVYILYVHAACRNIPNIIYILGTIKLETFFSFLKTVYTKIWNNLVPTYLGVKDPQPYLLVPIWYIYEYTTYDIGRKHSSSRYFNPRDSPFYFPLFFFFYSPCELGDLPYIQGFEYRVLYRIRTKVLRPPRLISYIHHISFSPHFHPCRFAIKPTNIHMYIMLYSTFYGILYQENIPST